MSKAPPDGSQARSAQTGWAERECRGPECVLLPKGALRALNPDLLTSPAPATGAAEVHADTTTASGPNLCRGRANEAVIQTGPSRASRLSQATLSSSLFPVPGPQDLRLCARGWLSHVICLLTGEGGGREEAFKDVFQRGGGKQRLWSLVTRELLHNHSGNAGFLLLSL